MPNFKNDKFLGLTEHQFILLLFATGLLLRIAYVLLIRVHIGRPIIDDELKYFDLAANIIDKGFYGLSICERAYYTPGYPLLLTLVFNLFGKSLIAAGILNAVFSALIPPLLYILTKLIRDRKTAILAACIGLIYPYYFYYSPLLLTETANTFFPLLGTTLLLMGLDKDCYFKIFMAGLAIGVSSLIKPTSLAYPLLAVIYLLLTRKYPLKKLLKIALAYTVAVYLFIAPWIIRNYFVFGEFLATSSKSGRIFLGGNHFFETRNDQNMGTYVFEFCDAAQKYLKGTCSRNEIDLDNRFFKGGVLELKNNYTKIPKLILKKFVNFWGVRPDPTKAKWTRNDFLSLFSYGVILIFFVVGFFKTFRPWDKIFIFHIMIIYQTLLALFFWGTPRFRLPISPYIIILSSMVILALFESFISKLKAENSAIQA